MGTGMLGSLIGGLLRDGLVLAGAGGLLSYRIALLAGVAFILASLVPFAGIRGRGPAAAPAIPDDPAGTGPAGITVEDEDGRLRNEAVNPGGAAAGAADRVSPDKPAHIPWVKLLLPGFLIGTGAGLTIPWINLYFKDVFGLGDGVIGLLFALGQVGTFVGIAAGPAMARRFGTTGAIVWCQALSIPFIIVLAWLHWLPLVVLAYLARQSLMNMSTPILDSFSLEQVPASKRHLLNALRMLNWTGAWMFAAWLAGLLIGRWGYSPSFTATAICYTVGTVLFALFWGTSRRSTAEAPTRV
jgi:MFS family permease